MFTQWVCAIEFSLSIVPRDKENCTFTIGLFTKVGKYRKISAGIKNLKCNGPTVFVILERTLMPILTKIKGANINKNKSWPCISLIPTVQFNTNSSSWVHNYINKGQFILCCLTPCLLTTDSFNSYFVINRGTKKTFLIIVLSNIKFVIRDS